MPLLLKTHLPNLFYRGKVRDTYDLGDKLLIVATDRISAFDSVLPSGIPDKGVVLNLLSAFWFQKTAPLMPNHFLQVVEEAHQLEDYFHNPPSYLARRSMLVRKAERIEVECVVRGYLAGSAWEEYSERGTVSGLPQPGGMWQAQKLPEPLFTPTTKAATGHDQALTPAEMEKALGAALAEELREKSLSLYKFASDYAQRRGVIIADTKMEFGLIEGQVVLIDELLTPDSSRFWDATEYAIGRPQPSFDKQPVRDWLIASGWDKEPPAPPLPPGIVAETTQRYREAYRRLTGRMLAQDVPG